MQSQIEKSSFKVSLLKAEDMDDDKVARYKVLPHRLKQWL